jgi:hypothetical protein
LGVYKLWFTEPTRASAQRIIGSRLQTPDDADLDDMIDTVLGLLGRRKRDDYERAIR